MKHNIYWLYVAVVLAAVALIAFMSWAPGETAYRAPAVSTPIRSDVTPRVQTRLHRFGLASVETLKTLGPLSVATATVPAVRTSPPVPTVPVGTSSCDEMSIYRQAAGLPAIFDKIGYRESRCRNDVRTWCCYGYLQNFLSSHLSSQSAYRDRIINECGVTQVSDIFGLSDSQKRASMCVSFVVYSISGMSPWNL